MKSAHKTIVLSIQVLFTKILKESLTQLLVYLFIIQHFKTSYFFNVQHILNNI